MKKLLALVLALVMTLGLATVAANAAYPDAADVDLTEAVEVMSAVGVFKGDEKGNFAPKANLDRAAAAKLIAYLDLGEKAAEALPAVKAFNDVPASHWAAKYVAYCANAGYINGAGDGNFYPSNSLTGYAFGKMILCVLGYDAAIEGFTGASWSINVAKLMDKNDINDDVDAAASANLTREQAAQYCLNALKADMVEYDTKGTTVSINGATIATGASKAEAVTVKASNTKNTYAAAIAGTLAAAEADVTVQLGEKLYDGDLKITNTNTDSFGAPARTWKYKTADACSYPDTPDATYTGKVTKGTIYTLLGKTVSDDIKDGNAQMTVNTDGAGAVASTDAVKGSSAAAFSTDKGMITEVYIDDDGAPGGYAKVTVIVKNVYLMQATADYNSKTEKLSVDSFGFNGLTSLSDTNVADGISIEDYKDEDYILYTFDGTEVQSMQKAEVVSGKVNSYKTSDNVKIDGTSYSYSKQFADVDGAKNTAYSIGDTAKVVLDTQGNIIAIDSAKVNNDDVVYVLQVAKNGFDYQAKVVTVEGKKITVALDKDSKNNADVKISDGNMNTFAGIMAYDIQDDGSYELSSYAKKNTVASTLNGAKNELALNKKTSLNGYTANSSTVYIVTDEDDDITVYTGVKNAPTKVTFAAADQAYFVYNNATDKEITYLFVTATESIDDSSTTTDQQIYVLRIKGDIIKDENKKEYYEVEALVDGTKETLKVAEGKTPFVRNTLYKSYSTDSNGFVTSAKAFGTKSEVVNIDDALDAFKFSDGVFTAPGMTSNGFVKTDKVYVSLTKATAPAQNKLMEDPDANYELAGVSTFKELANFVKGSTIDAKLTVILSENAGDSDAEVIGAYVTITESYN